MNSRSFLARLGSARLGIAFASLAAISVAPVWAQSSSSSDFQTQTESRSLYQNQYPSGGGGYGHGGYNKYPTYNSSDFHRLAIVAGAGFDAPLANTGKIQTFGYNIRAGAGYNFSRHFGALIEYEFNRLGIQNSVLAAVGEPDGNTHLWGFTLDPIYNYKTSGKIGGYVTGGGGFYRKLTSFTQPEYLGNYCDYFYGCFPQYGNVVVEHFSSNQGGANLGTAITYRISDSGTRFFAEARYEWIDSPRSSGTTPGTGTVSMIPVTFGVRW